MSGALAAVGDRTVRLYDLESGRELHCFQGHEAPPRRVVFHRDRRVALEPDDRLATMNEPEPLARFWAAALGYVLEPPPSGFSQLGVRGSRCAMTMRHVPSGSITACELLTMIRWYALSSGMTSLVTDWPHRFQSCTLQ